MRSSALLGYSAALVALLLLAAPPALSSQSETDADFRHMSVDLELENATAASGAETTLAIVMTPQPGWHGYWKSPGDAGLPNEIKWSSPPGVEIGELQYPVPRVLLMQGLMNHIYEGQYAILSRIRVPPNLKPGTVLPLSAKLKYLVCTESACVPENAEVRGALTIGDVTVPGH